MLFDLDLHKDSIGANPARSDARELLCRRIIGGARLAYPHCPSGVVAQSALSIRF